MNASVETPFGLIDQNQKAWELVQYYLGPIMPFYTDPEVTEIMVNRWDTVFIERSGRTIERTEASFTDELQVVTAIQQIANALNQPVGEGRPILDARFPDQSRACCTLKNGCSPDGSTITIRRAPRQHLTVDDLLGFGAINRPMLEYLKAAVEEGANMLIVGGTSSGKTTIIRALTRFIPSQERVITCEDTRELVLTWLPNAISHEAPKRRLSDDDQLLTLTDLIKTALRERPDRILVGEIRDGAAADAFLQAMTSGHSGCMTSLHANGTAQAITRLQYLIASQGAISYDLAGHSLLSVLNVVVYAAKKTGLGKKVMEVAEVIDGKVRPMFQFDRHAGEHVATDALSLSAYR